LEDIAVAIRLDPENALAYNNRAYVYELLDNTDNAQQDYQQACALGYQPACETVAKLKHVITQQRQATINELTDRSYQQFQQQDWQGVVKTATELLVLDPDNTVALVNRAGAYTELGKYKNALDDCNTALIVDPNMGIAYNNKGYVLELMGELKQAAMEYETACVLGVQQSCSDYKRLSQKVSVLN
jgi:Flp pilus assembly protein TadD